jgi:hypothetical protein
MLPHSSEDTMLDASLRFRRVTAAALVALAPLAACAPTPVAAPATPVGVGGATTLLVRLGADTIAMEQYTRTPTRMEGVLVQRSPFTTIARYSVDVGPTSAPLRAEYSLRRGDGTTITGQMQSLSVRYAGFDCPDRFVVGYGLDFAERYRNLADIFAVDDLKALRADPDALVPLLTAS